MSGLHISDQAETAADENILLLTMPSWLVVCIRLRYLSDPQYVPDMYGIFNQGLAKDGQVTLAGQGWPGRQSC